MADLVMEKVLNRLETDYLIVPRGKRFIECTALGEEAVTVHQPGVSKRTRSRLDRLVTRAC